VIVRTFDFELHAIPPVGSGLLTECLSLHSAHTSSTSERSAIDSVILLLTVVLGVAFVARKGLAQGV
jgi:hypothetical protein